MNKALILLFALMLHSCNNTDESLDTKIPTCIQNIIDDPIASKDLKTVKVQEVKNELHYWLNTDQTHVDGAEYIINSKCDTVCFYCGFCIRQDCIKDYPENWTIVWTK